MKCNKCKIPFKINFYVCNYPERLCKVCFKEEYPNLDHKCFLFKVLESYKEVK